MLITYFLQTFNNFDTFKVFHFHSLHTFEIAIILAETTNRMTIYPSFLDLLDNEQSYVEKNAFSNEHDNNNSAFPMNPFSCKTVSSDDRPPSTLETDFSDDDFVSDQYLNHSCSSLDLDKEVEAITMRAQRLFPDEDKDWTEFGWLLDAKWDETNNMPQKV